MHKIDFRGGSVNTQGPESNVSRWTVGSNIKTLEGSYTNSQCEGVSVILGRRI
jgi:hypothetical protein